MPHWLNYIMKICGHTRQISMVILILIMFIILNNLKLNIIVAILYLWMITIIIPNRNNYNDNSSGVIALLNIAHEVSRNNEYGDKKEKIAFVFFNNEEWGFLGSAHMKRYWNKNEISLENKKIINIDCVGAGNNIMITHGKNENLANNLEESLKKSEKEIIKYRYKIMPLSDEYNFKKYNIAGIVFCNKTIIPGGYYIPLVHSSRDKILDLENVRWLTKKVLDLI